MVCRFINFLPRRWRFRTQRIWMHIRDVRDQLWSQTPSTLFLGAFTVPSAALILLIFIHVIAKYSVIIWTCFFLYGLALLVLSFCKAIAVWRSR